jgi:predicted O-methyltransferase YrrM
VGLRTWLGLKKRRPPRPVPNEFLSWFEGKEFTTDWTTSNLGNWHRHLEPLRAKATALLEIGSFEGHSTVFFLNYFPAAGVTCIDPFQPSDSVLEVDGTSEQRFDRNVAPFGARLRKIKGRSIPELDALSQANEQFDVIYVDGDHSRAAALVDSILAWPMLKPGGVMIWDDYKWMQTELSIVDRPEQAIDTFLSLYRDELTILHQDYQAMAQKIR